PRCPCQEMPGTEKVMTRFSPISTRIGAACAPGRRFTMKVAADTPNTQPLAPSVPVSQACPTGSAITDTEVCPASLEPVEPAEQPEQEGRVVADVAEGLLEVLPHDPQSVHVQRQVQDPAVQEARGEEGPRHQQSTERGEDPQLLDDPRGQHLPEIGQHAQADH